MRVTTRASNGVFVYVHVYGVSFVCAMEKWMYRKLHISILYA